MKAGKRIAVLLFLGTVLAGCWSAISEEIRAEADESLTFEQVISDPDQYKGKVVIWGGVIVEARNMAEETEIELLNHPLAGNDRPRLYDPPTGRFIVLHKGFLDPAVYGPGRELTVAGRIVGRQKRPLEATEYAYPVIEERQLYLWEPRRPGPAIGIGVGVTIGR